MDCPIRELLDDLATTGRPSLAWAIRWDATAFAFGMADGLAAAWRSIEADPDEMVAVLRGCGRIIEIVGDSVCDRGYDEDAPARLTRIPPRPYALGRSHAIASTVRRVVPDPPPLERLIATFAAP